MRKVSEYEAHAAECRRLADQMSNPEHKKQLIQMAETWEMLAIARVKQLSRKKSKGDIYPRASVPSATCRAGLLSEKKRSPRSEPRRGLRIAIEKARDGL